MQSKPFRFSKAGGNKKVSQDALSYDTKTPSGNTFSGSRKAYVILTEPAPLHQALIQCLDLLHGGIPRIARAAGIRKG